MLAVAAHRLQLEGTLHAVTKQEASQMAPDKNDAQTERFFITECNFFPG